ncbi:MAG TPA: ComEC/Rec2 family competence protein [Mycobacteriales bacterium]|nr:ComEC/Rec2 family competence protein [Mycobacteriales bacterium]
MRRAVLVAAAAGGWLAAAAATMMSPRTGVVVGLGAAASVPLFGRWRRRWRQLVAAALVGVAAGALSGAWHLHRLHDGPVWALAGANAEVEVHARLVRDPTPVLTSAGAVMTLTDATVTAVYQRGWIPVSAPVLVISFGRGWTGLLPGQQVELSGRISRPRRGDSVTGVIDVDRPPTLLGRPPWWQRLAGRVRQKLEQACAGLPADERGLVPGLVDGDAVAEPAGLRDDMRLTGLTHLQAVSGENVNVILAVALAVARSIGLRRRSRIAVSAAALLGFVVLARPSPSVLRAAVMGGLALIAMAAGRRSAALPALAVSVLVLVVVNPFLARSIGFILSVCATAGLIMIAPRWTGSLRRWMPRPLAAAIAVPAAAQLACTPALVVAFGQLTPYAVPANLLAGPAVAPATILGVGAAVLATLSVPLGTVMAWAAAMPATMIAVVARGGAGLPAAGVEWSRGLVIALLPVAAALLAAALLLLRWRRRAGVRVWGRARVDPRDRR